MTGSYTARSQRMSRKIPPPPPPALSSKPCQDLREEGMAIVFWMMEKLLWKPVQKSQSGWRAISRVAFHPRHSLKLFKTALGFRGIGITPRNKAYLCKSAYLLQVTGQKIFCKDKFLKLAVKEKLSCIIITQHLYS